MHGKSEVIEQALEQDSKIYLKNNPLILSFLNPQFSFWGFFYFYPLKYVIIKEKKEEKCYLVIVFMILVNGIVMPLTVLLLTKG